MMRPVCVSKDSAQRCSLSCELSLQGSESARSCLCEWRLSTKVQLELRVELLARQREHQELFVWVDSAQRCSLSCELSLLGSESTRSCLSAGFAAILGLTMQPDCSWQWWGSNTRWWVQGFTLLRRGSIRVWHCLSYWRRLHATNFGTVSAIEGGYVPQMKWSACTSPRVKWSYSKEAWGIGHYLMWEYTSWTLSHVRLRVLTFIRWWRSNHFCCESEILFYQTFIVKRIKINSDQSYVLKYLVK